MPYRASGRSPGSARTVLLEDMKTLTGKTDEIDRVQKGALYEKILRERFVDSGSILANAGGWVADRVVA